MSAKRRASTASRWAKGLPPLERSSFEESPSITSNSSDAEVNQLEAELQRLKEKVSQIRANKTVKSTTPESDFEVVDVDPAVELKLNSHHKTIIVIKQFPLVLKKGPDGKWGCEHSDSDLINLLWNVRKSLDVHWVGVPNQEISQPDHSEVTALSAEHSCTPVLLDSRLSSSMFNKFCRGILWPLFHYVPIYIEDLLPAMRKHWDSYLEVNKRFAQAVLDKYVPGDIVWVHGYHFMLVPSLLRMHHPNMRIGFFFHSCFPTAELFRQLPVAQKLLDGINGSDVIGFHTFEYCRHFRSAITTLLSLEVTHAGFDYYGRFVRVGAFPIGIDPNRLQCLLEQSDTKKVIHDFRNKFAGRKVIVDVDQLSTVKGLQHKLYAIDRLLEDHPEWRGKLVVVQVSVCNGEPIPNLAKLKDSVHELVGRVNGKHGMIEWTPVHYLEQPLSFQEKLALFHIADVGVITPIRDGWNLNSFEFALCQNGKESPGMLVLSEFIGSTVSLGAGCLRVNPWNTQSFASALHEALTMNAAERQIYHKYSYEHVAKHTLDQWASSMLAQTIKARQSICTTRTPVIPRPLPFESVTQAFKTASNKLLVFGLVGTLTAPVSSYPTGSDKFLKIARSTLTSLNRLAEDANTTVVVVTGKGRKTVARLFKESSVWLACENGFFLRKGQQDWEIMHSGDMTWHHHSRSVFDYFVERTPRSYVDVGESMYAWHFEASSKAWAQKQKIDFLTHLTNTPVVNHACETVVGQDVVQLRPAGVAKDSIVEKIVHLLSSNKPIDFVLCAGHFLPRDEDVYTVFDDIDSQTSSPHNEPAFSDPTEYFRMTPQPSPTPGNGPSSSPVPASLKTMLSEYMHTPEQPHAHLRRAEIKDVHQHQTSVFNVTVGRTRASLATYFLDDSTSVSTMLTQLLAAMDSKVDHLSLEI